MPVTFSPMPRTNSGLAVQSQPLVLIRLTTWEGNPWGRDSALDSGASNSVAKIGVRGFALTSLRCKIR
jgi:hypothetical protein